MSLPSLNLSFEKRSATNTSLSSANANDNSAKNSVVLNIINPLADQSLSPRIMSRKNSVRSIVPEDDKREKEEGEIEDDEDEDVVDVEMCFPDVEIEEVKRPQITSPRPQITSPRPRNALRSGSGGSGGISSQKINPISSSPLRKSAVKASEPDCVPPPSYASPAFPEIEKEFKDQLLSFTMDLLLSDFDLLKNVSERGNKVLFHAEQLKQLIAILYLKREERHLYDKLIEIETEPILTNCCIKTCTNPFYMKIKSIFINNSINFLSTPYAVSMMTEFKISLESCLNDKKNK
jgi:hypothetical protein